MSEFKLRLALNHMAERVTVGIFDQLAAI